MAEVFETPGGLTGPDVQLPESVLPESVSSEPLVINIPAVPARGINERLLTRYYMRTNPAGFDVDDAGDPIDPLDDTVEPAVEPVVEPVDPLEEAAQIGGTESRDIVEDIETLGEVLPDIAQGVLSGTAKGFHQINKLDPTGILPTIEAFGKRIANFLGIDTGIDEPKYLSGKLAEGFGQFLPGIIPATKVARLMIGTSNIIRRVAAELLGGAVGDYATSSEVEAEGLVGLVKMIDADWAQKFGDTIQHFITKGGGEDIDDFRARLVGAAPGVLLTPILAPLLEGLIKIASSALKSGAAKDLVKVIDEVQQEAVQRLREGKSPIPVGMSIEDVSRGGAQVAETATDLDPLGFFSAVSRAVDDLPMEKGDASQMRAMIAKSEGVKQEEMAWIGLDDFLKGRKKVTKQEIRDFVDANQVEIREVTSRTGYTVDAGRVVRDTKYGEFTLPGGENYREVRLTLPEAYRLLKEKIPLLGGEFRGGHFDESNVLAHIRLNDRIGPNGERILFIEEIQSDWHQKGRKKGYRTGDNLIDGKDYNWWRKETDRLFNDRLSREKKNAWLAAVENRQQLAGIGGSAVPDAPFKKTWHEMAFRRVMRMAAEEDYDVVAWTPGKIQNARYNLSKQLDTVRIEKLRDGTKDGQYHVTGEKDGQSVGLQEVVTEDKLADVIGKDLAEKAIKDAPKWPDGRDYSGLDLQIGGEGMKAFYDKMLKNYASKWGKKFGAKVSMEPFGLNMGGATLDKTKDKYWTLPITEKMRDSAMKKGVPLFGVAAVATGAAMQEERSAPEQVF